MTMQWIKEEPVGEVGGVPGTLGALSEGPNLQAKALLSIWLKNNQAAGSVAVPNYGFQNEDHQPAWNDRDGWMLSVFSAWWVAQGKGFLDVGALTPHGGRPWVDLDQAHKEALDTWAVENGFLPPALAPGAAPFDCVQSCATAHTFDPAGMIACMQKCASGSSGQALPIPIPAIPGIPGIPNIAQSNAPAGWPAGFPWPPPVPSWLPAPATPIWPPIGNWGSGGLQKPSWWDATGVPWPPPKPGAVPGFPGQWPQGFPFPVPPAQFVQTNAPAPAGQAPCAKGTVWDGTSCQPLPTAPAPIPAGGAKKASSTGPILIALGAVALVAVLVSSVGGLPAAREEEEL